MNVSDDDLEMVMILEDESSQVKDVKKPVDNDEQASESEGRDTVVVTDENSNSKNSLPDANGDENFTQSKRRSIKVIVFASVYSCSYKRLGTPLLFVLYYYYYSCTTSTTLV